jgi:uncharacterized protein (TIGR02996 family)
LSSAEELEEALAIWRETRAVAVADAIDELSRAALAGWTAPVHRRNQPFHEAWLVAGRDVVQRGWAAETLLVQLPAQNVDADHDQQQRNAEALVARLDALARQGPDPRVARAVINAMATGTRLLGYPEAPDACVRALAPSLDDRTAGELERSRATARPWKAKLIERVLAERPVSRAPTSVGVARFAGAKVDDAALWQEILARPDDDDSRHVLADALQTRGDPRGGRSEGRCPL